MVSRDSSSRLAGASDWRHWRRAAVGGSSRAVAGETGRRTLSLTRGHTARRTHRTLVGCEVIYKVASSKCGTYCIHTTREQHSTHSEGQMSSSLHLFPFSLPPLSSFSHLLPHPSPPLPLLPSPSLMTCCSRQWAVQKELQCRKPSALCRKMAATRRARSCRGGREGGRRGEGSQQYSRSFVLCACNKHFPLWAITEWEVYIQLLYKLILIIYTSIRS